MQIVNEVALKIVVRDLIKQIKFMSNENIDDEDLEDLVDEILMDPKFKNDLRMVVRKRL